MRFKPRDEEQLIQRILTFKHTPLDFVRFVYPWGEAGTPLHKAQGPRRWQRDVLLEFTKWIQDNVKAADIDEALADLWRYAMASGRGPGKSALVSWIKDWFMSTHLGGTGIVSANTDAQLRHKTWAEMGKWHTLSINSHWFDRAATSFKPAEWFEKLIKTQLKIDTGYYYANATLWSEENPDAFAGAHNPLGELVIFDEASGIPANIYTVTEGFFTEQIPYRYWFCFSNPRRPSGPFFECFNKNRNLWRTKHLDARTVEGVDKKLYDAIVQQYGEDSDEARIEVYGEFPKSGERQFISRELVEEAQLREVAVDPFEPLIMGVDTARLGPNKSVVRWRQGRDARSIAPKKYRGLNTTQLARELAEDIDRTQPDRVCIDMGNTGSAVFDLLKSWGYHKLTGVWFGVKSDDPKCFNKRTEIWKAMRDWLSGGAIDSDATLKTDLAAPEYEYVGRESEIIALETKEDMKARGYDSPDDGDALACTFAVKLPRRQPHGFPRGAAPRIAQGVDYNPLAC